MPHYKAPDNSVHFIDSEEFVFLLPEGVVEITKEEAEVLTYVPPPPPPEPEPVAELDPVEKLRAFLAANPDVAAIL